MITEDEVMRLLERADPVRNHGAVPGTAAAGYLDAVRTRSMIVTLIDTEPRTTETSRRWPIIIATAAAVVAIVVGALVLAARDNTAETQIPAAPLTVAPSTTTPTTAAAAAPAEVLTPLADIKGRMSQGADVELFRVTTDEPTYWRLTTLSEFDGRSWRLPDRELSPIDDIADFEPNGRTIHQQLQILGLQGPLLPAAADPKQAAPSTDLRFNADTSTLVKMGELASGDQYTIVSEAPDVTLDELWAATTDNPPDDLFVELPDNVPAVVSDLAAEVTAGATTDADRMIALQDWFRSEFNYDLTVPAGHGGDAIEMFLDTRRGFCEQFSSTFAVMARTLGVPSRVAVGFTAGELNADGAYSVFGKNSHAWPEIWFDGIGWIPFEPTPQRAIPGAEDYTGVEADQQPSP